LGITNPTWASCPRGINLGGWGLSLRTTDVARFGQLYLNQGVWNGRRLLPEEWVREATGSQVSNDDFLDWGEGDEVGLDSRQGYGYQFWRCRYGAYRADGAFGQLCVVMPEQDAVLTITSGVDKAQQVLDLIWTHLLPAMANGPLAADRPAERRLEDLLAAARLPTIEAMTSPTAARVSGRTYRILDPAPAAQASVMNREGPPKIESVAFTAEPDGWAVTVRDVHGSHQLICGDGEWRLGVTALGTGREEPVAACGAWVDEDTYLMRVCFPETPFIRTFTCHFNGADLTITVRDNVSFGPTEHPPVLAHAD